MNKKQAFQEREAWAFAMRMAAADAGEGSWLYEAMGCLAWGRYEGEPCVSDSKDRAVEAVGYLKGMRDALLRVAESRVASRTITPKEAVLLRNIHDVVRDRLRVTGDGGAAAGGRSGSR